MQVLAHPHYGACAQKTSIMVNLLLEDLATHMRRRYVLSKTNSRGIAYGLNSLVNNYILRPDKEAFRLQYHALCRSMKKREV